MFTSKLFICFTLIQVSLFNTLHSFNMHTILVSILPTAEAKNSKSTQEKSKKTSANTRYKQRSKCSCSQHFSLDTSNESLIRHAINEQTRLYLSQKMHNHGVPVNTADKTASEIIFLLTELVKMRKTLNDQINDIQKQKKILQETPNKTADIINQIKQLDQQEKKLHEEKADKENMLGITATGISQVLAKFSIGKETKDALEILQNVLELSGHQYGAILGKIIWLIYSGIQQIQESMIGCKLNQYITYFNISYTRAFGGWLLAKDMHNGKIYMRLDQLCCNNPGHKHVEHIELLMDNTYPQTPIEEQLARIIANDYKLGEVIIGYTAI